MLWLPALSTDVPRVCQPIMFDCSRFGPWACDVALAYAGGLVFGAPLALVTVWMTGNERFATVSLLGAMACVYVARRRGRATGSTSTAREPDQRRSTLAPRRVA